MAVIALKPGYQGEVRDRQENYHGNQLVYFGWDQHRLFCAAFALPLPPTMPFKALVSDVITPLLASHPEGAAIDWSRAEWLRSNEPFTPDPEASLADNGLGHKTLLRLRTPDLTGIDGSCN
ncbi:phenol hydroxylase subunit P4 [Crenobacter sp. SG2305]|uniref:phenol hydroxylase subunit P4 n=1 Tax=Crenobacter oryzisoli TaxID=3056844 RepID=UPI0025AB1084|nr:phenol hydroxylase subunit P4 [Crenobacter sp. SG2305]MDN0083176.1 phenol hydroxylase subunit P4 [Crenobacter sp. SG2305]